MALNPNQSTEYLQPVSCWVPQPNNPIMYPCTPPALKKWRHSSCARPLYYQTLNPDLACSSDQNKRKARPPDMHSISFQVAFTDTTVREILDFFLLAVLPPALRALSCCNCMPKHLDRVGLQSTQTQQERWPLTAQYFMPAPFPPEGTVQHSGVSP